MRQDYLIEIFEELGKILASVMNSKKTDPGRALALINTAFKGTRFGDRTFFDSLDPASLKDWLAQQKMSYQSAEVIADLLLEEAEIRPNPLLPDKIRVMIDYAAVQQQALKIFSLKQEQQRKRLQELTSHSR